MKFDASDFEAGKTYVLKSQSFIVLSKKTARIERCSKPRDIDIFEIYFMTNKRKGLKHKVKTWTSTSFQIYLNKLCPESF
jgi:hypothetical protein